MNKCERCSDVAVKKIGIFDEKKGIVTKTTHLCLKHFKERARIEISRGNMRAVRKSVFDDLY